MSNQYPFKRSIFYDAERSIESNKVTFMLGARKTGKTVCMKQLADSLPNAEYYDIKVMNEDDAIDLQDEIVACIAANANRTFLIDETTYFTFPEKTIARIANEFADCQNTNTKVVFAGSQSVALEAWANRAFAGNAQFVYADFLSYPEWLAYKEIDEVSEKTYNQFVLGTREFYKDFVSLDQYLKGCLEETIVSNLKTSNVILNNNCDRLNEEILKNMLYAALVAQQDRPDINTFFDKNKLFREVRTLFKDEFRSIGGDEVQRRVDRIFENRLNAYSSVDMETFRQGLIFLYKSGLITLTYVSNEKENFENVVDVYMDLCRRYDNKINTKEELFNSVNICIKYPMFYAEILKEVLLDAMPSEIKGSILGGIVECHARGLLPRECSYEYHSNGREVDYVNFAERKAIEISIRDKGGRELAFDDLPDTFAKILLTKDQNFTQKDGLVRIPYYKFIFDNSIGKELLRQENVEASRKPKRPKVKFDRTDD